jgi:peptidoglycan/LPS O-acetylase OafA/YrhL
VQSPNRTYIAEVDELRGIAALLVLFYHSVHQGYASIGGQGWLTTSFPPVALLYEGHTGVSLFMVLSGFILAKGTFDKPLNYRRFIINRMLRIFPMMVFVNVFAMYANKSYTLEGAVAPFLFLYNTPIRLNDLTQLSATTWAVSVEFQFYLIAPFLFLFVGRRGLLGYVLPALALILAVRLIVFYPSWDTPSELVRITHYTIVGRLGQFLIGIALAYVIDRLREPKGANAWVLLTGSMAVMIAIAHTLNSGGGFPVWKPWRILEPELEGAAWAGVIAGYAYVRPLRWRPVQRAMVTAGILSFSIYILHWPVLFIFWGLYKEYAVGVLGGISGIMMLTTFVLLPPILALSALSYSCIEKPFLEMRKRYLPGGEPEPTTVLVAPKHRDSPLVLGTIVGAAALVAWLLWTGAQPWLNSRRTNDVCTRTTERSIALTPPFARYGAFGYTIAIPGTEDVSDSLQDNKKSTAVLCEDEKQIGIAHTLHADIDKQGGGRYSHWGGALYFSTPDNSDPNTNGRPYRLLIPSEEQDGSNSHGVEASPAASATSSWLR